MDTNLDPELIKIDEELEKEWKKEVLKRKRRRLTYDHRINRYRNKFNEYLHNKYDLPARDKLKDALHDFIYENPDPYKQDFIINSDTCKYKYIEVQVCSKWINEIYPMDTVWIYARKSVYDSDTLFITLSKNLKYGFIFDANSLEGVKPRRLKKYSREFVYDIPWYRIMKVAIETLDKETVELY